MENKRNQVNFNAKIKPIKPINDEFTLCKCYVMALGKNRNFSYISQEAADDALPSLFNVPVIGHLYVDDSGVYHMGGHDMAIEQNADGGFEFKSLCVPFGVVPSQENVHYEDIEESTGEVNRYLCADVILWTGRFAELLNAVYNENTFFGQSMEINVADYGELEDDPNYTDIRKYAYSALCLLGKSDDPDKHVEPCFRSSCVDPYEFSMDNAKFSELMEQMKDELAKCFVAETAPASDEPEPQSQNGVESKFTSTYREKYEALVAALPETENVMCWVCDFDDKYVYVTRTVFSDEAMPFETDGRYEYIWHEDEMRAELAGEFEEMIVKWLTKEEEAQLEAMRADYALLLDYKANREKADMEASIDVALKEFADLNGNAEFDAIVEKRYKYGSVEALQNDCYIIRGKYAIVSPMKKPAQMTVGIKPADDKGAPTARERLHEQYGRK